MKNYLYRASNLKSTITLLATVLFYCGNQFLAPTKNRRVLCGIHNSASEAS